MSAAASLATGGLTTGGLTSGSVSTLPRLPGWERRVDAVLEAARHRPYVLGAHDCFRVACRVIEAVVGLDCWPQFEGYTTRRQALARLAQVGRSFEAAGDVFFGAPAIDVRLARRADICCVQTLDGEKHLGVCLGAQVALCAPQGWIVAQTLACLCAWRVGR